MSQTHTTSPHAGCDHISFIAFDEQNTPDVDVLDVAEVAPIRQFLEVSQGVSQTFFRGRGLTLDHVLDAILRRLPGPAEMEEQWAGVTWDVTIWDTNRLVAIIQPSETAGIPHRVIRMGPPPSNGEAGGGAPGAGGGRRGATQGG